MKCLAKSPDHRYATGDDLRIDLLRFREGRAVGAASPDRAAPVGGDAVDPDGGGYPGAAGARDRRGRGRARAQPHPALCGHSRPAPGGVGGGHHLPRQLRGLVAHRWEAGGLRHARRDQPERGQRREAPHREGLKTKVEPDTSAKSTPNTQVLRTDPPKGTAVNRGDKVTLITGDQGPPVRSPPREPIGAGGQGPAAAIGPAGQRAIQQHLHATEHRLQPEPEVGCHHPARGHHQHLHAVDDDGGARRDRARPDHGVQPPRGRPASNAGPSPPSPHSR